MTNENDTAYWKRLDGLLEQALALPPDERGAWLERLPDASADYRARLAAMLAHADTPSDSFMGRPVAARTLEAAAHTLAADEDGEVVGPWRLLSRLGTGGMGTVWRAERTDGAVQRHVALKLPKSGWSPGLAERLRRECAILSTLEHPGIARLYDAGLAESGRPWLAMELIEGVPIDRYCRDHRLDVPARLRLFLQVARAIAYAHGRLVVHRDLKPSNVLVDPHGRAHVVDFGLAKLLEEGAPREPGLTQMLGRTLTPDYASPEQIRGEAIGVASDVYSLGVLLYELLTDKRPYRLKRESAAALEEAIAEADVPAASSRVAGQRALARALRGDLDTILAKALRKDCAERYATVEAFAADIGRHLEGKPVLARPPALGYVAGRFVRRHRAGVAAAALVAVAVLAGLAGTLYQAREAAAERDKALRELRFAEAADEFMRFLLSTQSAKPLPAAELLRRAERSAAEQFAREPALRARMQLLIADLHGEVSDFPRAEAMVAQARASAEAAGDRWLAIQADCVMAGVLGATGRREEALALFARAMPPVEADPRADPTATQVCHSQRSITLRLLGRAEESARDAEAALRSLDATSPGNRVNRIFLKTNVAEALVNGGRMPEAVRVFEEAAVELGRMGRGGTSAGLLLANNLMVFLTRAGQPRRAAEVYARLATGEDPDPPAYSTLSINYAKVLFEMGRAEEAGRLLEAAQREKARLGDRRGQAFAAMTAAQGACFVGDAARCEALLEDVTARMAAILPPTHSTFATLKYLAAQAAMSRGDAARARGLLEEAIRGYDAAPDRNLTRIRALSLLAVAQANAGDEAAARAGAQQAVEAARQAAQGFERSEWLGGALLAQAEVLARAGDAEGARRQLAEARGHLLETLGPGTPAMARADALASRLPSQRGADGQ